MRFKKLWRDFSNAGDKKDQVNALMAIWIVASDAFIRGAEDLRDKAEQFANRLEAWRDDLLAMFRGHPFVISEDRERTKKFLWGAIGALIIEAVLGTAIARRNGLPLWSGAFIALTLAVVFDAIFVLGWLRARNYRAALDTLRRFFLYPSAVVFGISLSIFFLGRMARGSMAASLAPFVSASLWAATLSLLILGATLLACAFIYNWSSRDKKGFDAVQSGQTALRVVMDKALRELLARGVDVDPLLDKFSDELKVKNLWGFGTNLPAPISTGVTNGAATAVKLLPVLLLMVALSNSSCTMENQNAGGEAQQEQSTQQATSVPTIPADLPLVVPPDGPDEIDLIWGVDGTGSTHPSANRMLANNFKKDDVRICTALGVHNLRVFEFIENGRVPVERNNIDLPKFVRPQISKVDAGDAGILDNIEDGVNEDNKAHAEQEFRASLIDHSNKMNKALNGLTAEHFMPSKAPEPKCSDINGFISFLATSGGERRRIAVLVTDGKETCSDGIMTTAIPGDLTLVILVLPLTPEEADDEHGIDSKFQERLDRIKQALPTAFVVPYNADVYKVLTEADKKARSRNKVTQKSTDNNL